MDTKKILADVKALTEEVERLESAVERQDTYIKIAEHNIYNKDKEITRLKKQWWRV